MAFWDGQRWIDERTPEPKRASRSRRRAGPVLIGIVAMVALALPASAFAAKGGGAGGVTPWIALGSVNGSAATVKPSLGSSVGFSTGYPTNTKNPWVSVICWQDGAMVYGEGNTPGSTFVLGGASSLWTSTGGTAACQAELGDLYWRGGHQYYTFLARTSFEAAG